jgi:DNA-binding CsgD family transcriptional regulator
LSLDDGLSKFLGELYEAVHHPEGWRTAIAETIRRSGSRRLLVTSVDLRRKNLIDVQIHGSEDSSVDTGMQEYAQAMATFDPTLEWAHENPDALMCESAAVLPKDEYHGHPFIKWWKSRFGTSHWRVFYTQPVDDLSFAVSFHAPPDFGPPSRSQLPLQQLLFENLERAVRLAARPPNFAADDSALVAVDMAGRPLSLSQRAEEILQEDNGLSIIDGLLGSKDPRIDRQLKHAIRAAVDPASGELAGRGIRIHREACKSDLFVVASSFPPYLDYLPTPRPAALVRLIELNMRPDHLIEHSHLFDLSPRQTEVAAALLEGHSIDSMAASLGMSRNTARNHVQALLRKTDTNRQSDLVRVLDRIARQ